MKCNPRRINKAGLSPRWWQVRGWWFDGIGLVQRIRDGKAKMKRCNHEGWR